MNNNVMSIASSRRGQRWVMVVMRTHTCTPPLHLVDTTLLSMKITAWRFVVACHNGSVPRWLRAMCWNGHREARATMVRHVYILIYVYAVWMGGAGGGCQWLAGLDGRGWGLGWVAKD